MEDLTPRIANLEENMRRHRHLGYDQTTEIKSVKQFSYLVSYQQFKVAALTNKIILTNLPIFGEIISAFMYVEVAFVGTATLNLSVGQTSDTDGLLTAQDGKTTGFKNVIGTDLTTNRAVYSATANTPIVVEAVATVNNLSLLTAGRVRIYLTYNA